MSKSTEFDRYLQLLHRVDEKFAEVQKRHPKSFTCQTGCFGCCKSGLSVTNVESQRIRSYLQNRPDTLAKVKDANVKRFHGVEFCSFLDSSGACLIYEARPLVCRSHGAPTLMPAEDSSTEMVGDVCPLNFQDFDLNHLESSDWIRLDTINLMLVAVDREFDQEKMGIREALERIPDTI